MPVIPVAVVGTDVVAPPGKTFGKFTRPIVRFGKPLDFSRYEGMENDRYILRSITDEIMYEIMRLSGQEYVDKYAARAKEEASGRARRGRRRGPRVAAELRRADEGVLTGRAVALAGAAVPPGRAPRLVRAGGHRRGPHVPLAGGPAAGPLVNAVALNVFRRDNFVQQPARQRPRRSAMVAWTGVAIWAYAEPSRRGRCCWSPTWRVAVAADR